MRRALGESSAALAILFRAHEVRLSILQIPLLKGLSGRAGGMDSSSFWFKPTRSRGLDPQTFCRDAP